MPRSRRLGGLPLVFIHGFLGARSDWDAVAEWLGRDGVRLGLPGHEGAPLGDARLSLDDLADAAVAEVESAVGEGPAVWVGYSLGGRLAIAAAARHPVAVAGLVAVSASPGIDDAEARAERAALDVVRAEELRRDANSFVSAWYRQPLFAYDDASAAAAAARRSNVDAAALSRVVAELSPGVQPSRWAVLAGLECRSLWLAGARDAAYVASAAHAAALSGGRFAAIDGGGHAVHLDRPAQVAARLAAFVQDPDDVVGLPRG
ncbi:MAG: alpha/beta fold hydrolase [Myxococcales bacterium]|nr:alpha/beta fold hydrolase [Myxococcales bacterium]